MVPVALSAITKIKTFLPCHLRVWTVLDANVMKIFYRLILYPINRTSSIKNRGEGGGLHTLFNGAQT